jgi:L,D-peptidoglycan transpeptidase YkuD (ErfK/YbiS/YcfS/YnhG family)
MMKKTIQWVMAATLVCGISMFTACSSDDNLVTEKGQLLEVFDVNGSEATARLTVDGKVLFTTSVYIGKNGLGKNGEGDGKTPVGTLRPLSAFGVKPNPGTTMPYIDVTPTIYACDEDCEYYNQIIDAAALGHECKGEEMYSYQPQYNYGIATDFNKECIYPKGSAIFIHVKGTKTYTGGCIAFDEDRMVEILRNCDMSLVITIKE